MIDRAIFDAMFEKIPMGIFIFDKEGYIKFVNPMACKMTGYGVNELIGMKGIELIPNEFKAAAKSFSELQEGKESEEKVYYKTKSADLRLWDKKTMKINDEIYVQITEDITEYEKIVAENEKYLNRLKLAGKAGKVGSWEYDVKSKLFWRSAEASRQFTGKSIEETCTLDELSNNLSDSKSLEKGIRLILSSGEASDKEFEVIPEHIDEKTILKTYASTVCENDKIVKITGATVDITEIKKAQNQIMEDKNQLQEYLDIAEVILLVIDNFGIVEMINRKGCEVLGYDEKEILGKSWIDNFIPLYLRDKIRGIHKDNIFNVENAILEFENPVINAKGEERTIYWKNTIIKDSDGIVVGTMSSGEDITDRKLIERALERSEISLKKAEVLTRSGHFEINVESNAITWSDGMYILMGYKPQSFVITAKTDSEIMTPKSRRKLEKAYHNAIRENGTFETEVEAQSKDNGILILRIKGVIEYEDKKPAKILATCQDITGSKAHLEHIEYISYHDQLTGLFNRRYFEEEFGRLSVQRNYPLAIIMADVNGLKLANDTFGHAEGDQMLINTAEVLKQSVRKDDIIARVGGDEYMILLPKIDNVHVEKIMNRIVKDSKNFQTTMLPLSIALGSAVKEDDSISRDEIFKMAEDNMYRSKLHEVSSRRSEAIKIVSDTLYEKNRNVEAHSKRVSKICVMIGSALGLPRSEINELKTLGLMHDIGKIAIKEELLNKSSALTVEDFEKIKKHSEAGFRILSTSNDMAELANYVLSHHERWDGKGYPRGLAGTNIPFMSRIVAIAEAYDAMTNKNPYGKPLSHRKAYLEIRKCSGTQFDPDLSKLFLQEVWPDLA